MGDGLEDGGGGGAKGRSLASYISKKGGGWNNTAGS